MKCFIGFREGLWTVVAAAVLGFTGPALAQSGGNQTGLYLGLQGGYGWGDVDWANISLLGESVEHDADGLVAGGHVGYQHDVGDGFLVGIEGTLSYADMDEKSTSSVTPAASFRTDIDLIATVTGRVGMAVGDFTPYVKAGYAGAKVETSGKQSALPDSFSDDDWEHGWTVGAGLAYTISDNLSIGAEYTYIDLGETSRSGTTRAGFNYTLSDLDVKIHMILAKITYRFSM